MRTATVDDLEELVDLFLQCWTRAYTGLLPERTVAAMDQHSAADLWREVLTGAHGGVVTVATEDDGGRILGVTRWSPRVDGVGVVNSLYVHPSGQGRGTGAQLLAFAAEALAAGGATRAVLWVFEGNRPAREFYARQGWRPTGQQQVDPRFGIPELQLGRSLVPGAET